MLTKCFTLDDIKRVFKIECFQKDPETFEKTHYSSSFVFKDPQFREKVMMEDALLESEWEDGLDERRRTGDFIRPYVIWGATGTGKTELCRFLELNIPKSNVEYESRRITKRELAMGGILGVAQALSHLEIDLAQRLLSRHAGIGVEDVAVFALGSLVQQGKITIQAEDKNKVLEMCKTPIRNNVEKRVKLVESAEDISKVETSLEFLTSKDLNALSYYGINMDLDKTNRELFRALTRFVSDADDVKRLIFDFIREKNNSGKIPVLIFDDVTHLGDLVDDFIGVITDISGGKEGYVCDFIIGTTTQFYFKKFRDALISTARERISEIKLSPEETYDLKNANWLMGEDGLSHFLDFVLRYLDACRTCDGCSKCKSPFLDGEYNYYPFTKTFLVNFYNRMIREKDERERRGITVSVTPRFIIKVLRNVLGNFVETSKLPSNFMDSSFILDTKHFFKLKNEEKERLKEFLQALWWYGRHSDDETKVTLEIETSKNLGLVEQFPEHLRGKATVQYEVTPLRVSQTSPTGRFPPGVIRPIRPDDASMLASIESWCKGEDTIVPIGSMVQGFNEVIKRLNENLSGSNNFRNIMNYKSSRRGENIELHIPGKKEQPFWIGKIGVDDLQLYLMSAFQKEKLILLQEKGFLILPFNPNDFLDLYRIGAPTTPDPEKIMHLQNFLTLRRNDVWESLSLQRQRLKKHLEKQLGNSVECLVLSIYLLANKILKSQTVLSEIKDASDLKGLTVVESDLDYDDWSSEISSFMNSQAQRIDLKIAEDLFHSFFSLRGEGSIIDYPLLEETWSHIKNKPFQILNEVGQIDDHFVLSQSKIRLERFATFFKDLLHKIETFSQTYDENIVKKKIKTLKELLLQLSPKDQIINALEILKEKLEKDESTADNYDLVEIIPNLLDLENPDLIIEKLDLLEKKTDSIKDIVDKAVILAILRNIERHPTVDVGKDLLRIIEDMETKSVSILEKDLENLRTEILKYLELRKVL